jgi:hypothetical protein
MSESGIVWLPEAPADYVLVFRGDPDGDHSVVIGTFPDSDNVFEVGKGLQGAELDGQSVRVHCTLAGEAERVRRLFSERGAIDARAERGTVAFVAVGSWRGTSQEILDRRREVTAHIVVSGGGEGARAHRFDRQCERCGEFQGQVLLAPRDGVMIDNRQLRCRCDSIPCRYCESGSVRRPLSEHLDPERRAGSTPWFGYLVSCGGCQIAGRGPQLQLST